MFTVMNEPFCLEAVGVFVKAGSAHMKSMKKGISRPEEGTAPVRKKSRAVSLPSTVLPLMVSVRVEDFNT